MKALFFPQNETHLNNMMPVAEILQNTGIEIVFLDTRNIYKQNLKFNPKFSHKALKLDFDLEKSFYKIGIRDRIKFIALHKNKIIKFANQFDFFVFGNDGALQRIVINYANTTKKSSFIILDGIISDYSYTFFDIIKNKPDKFLRNSFDWAKNFIKNLVSNMGKQLPMNYYLPSHAGCAKVDAVFVIGKHSQLALKKICGQQKSYAYGLPYMNRLFRPNHTKNTNKINSIEIKILFLSSAYKWHSLYDLDEAQHKDIALLCNIINNYNINKKNKIKFYIKLHPREDRESYEMYSAYDFVEIIENGNLDEIILDSDIIFSHISTTIIESILLGKPIYSLMINFPYWKFKNSFISNESIQKIYSKSQLINIIKNYCQPIPQNKTKIPNQIFELISLSTPASARMISEKIINIINQKESHL